MTNIKLTKSRKTQLDRYSEEDINFFYSIFTREEKEYIKKTEQENREKK
tara:strand:+ start:559 stop:705 length:147 start_codon:yes stop_codon:yes gene_type:complete